MGHVCPPPNFKVVPAPPTSAGFILLEIYGTENHGNEKIIHKIGRNGRGHRPVCKLYITPMLSVNTVIGPSPKHRYRVEWGNAPMGMGKTPTTLYRLMYEWEVPAGIFYIETAEEALSVLCDVAGRGEPSNNPRTAGGSYPPPPPQVFRRLRKKRRRVAPPNLP